jgi:hypothetical protein
MVQFGKRAVFVLAAVALIGVAGTAAAASMAAPGPTHIEHRQITSATGEPVAQPVATPHHHGGCQWGGGDPSMKYQ